MIPEPLRTGVVSVPASRRRPLRVDPVLVVSIVVVVLVVIAAMLAPWVAPYDPYAQELGNALAPPSAEHLLGTDTLGRDTLSRLVWGARPTLWGVLTAVVTFVIVGVLLGLVAGYFRGWTDALVGWIADILMSVPGIVMVLAVLAVFEQELLPAMVLFGMLGSGGLIRITRAAVLAVRSELFVAAAKVSGLGELRILLRHVLPNLVGPTTIQASLFAVAVLGVQTGLGFLNLGVVPPAPSWGSMIGEAAGNLAQAGLLLLVGGAAIGVLSLAFALIGEAIRDASSRAVSSASGGGAAGRPPSPQAPQASQTTDPGDASLVRLDDVTICVPGRKDPVVVDVSFGIGRGEIVGLVGESGSGKTITSSAILGLLPRGAYVAGGSIRMGELELAGAAESAFACVRGRRIGLVSQEPMVALDPLFTVGHQLEEALAHASDLPRSARRTRAEDLLRSVHLPDPAAVLDRYPHELSGGMAQRVVIAVALAGDPDVLIADEPTTALDVTVQAGILALLRELRDTAGLGVLLVTHDLGVVADVCDRVLVMESGRIVERGDTEQLFASPSHEYTRSLLTSTPSILEKP